MVELGYIHVIYPEKKSTSYSNSHYVTIYTTGNIYWDTYMQVLPPVW
jgi:hypothetical protein